MRKVLHTSLISRCAIIFAAFIMIVFPTASVFAQQQRLSDDPNFLMSNDIFFYTPGSNTCTTPGANYSTSMDLPLLTGNENAEKIWNFLKDEDFSDEQAAGIMGNIRQESNYDPAAEEDNGVGFGLIQWSNSRRTDLESAAKEKGVPVSDLSFQLLYLKQEASSSPLSNFNNLFENFEVTSTDNVWDALKGIKGIDKTTTFFHDGFERSGDYEKKDFNYSIQHRIDFANQALASFRGGGSSGGGGGGGSSTFGSSDCTPFAGGDLIQTLLAYAHPTHTSYKNNGKVDPEPKPAYVEAATKLQGEHKWVGGGNIKGQLQPSNPFPAIDCGGFVSILLTQSGFEPDYNYGLDPDKGASNQIAQLKWARENWTEIGIGRSFDVSELRPGDVAYTHENAEIPGHTFLYVGDIEGFDGQFASASYALWRAPMAAGSYENPTDENYVWYGRR